METTATAAPPTAITRKFFSGFLVVHARIFLSNFMTRLEIILYYDIFHCQPI
mgnify:CR=1 FL=1|jgi:hypothetical protein